MKISRYLRALHDHGAWRAVDEMIVLLASTGATDVLVLLLSDKREDLRRVVAESFDSSVLRPLLAHPSARVRDAVQWGLIVNAHVREGRLAGRLALVSANREDAR